MKILPWPNFVVAGNYPKGRNLHTILPAVRGGYAVLWYFGHIHGSPTYNKRFLSKRCTGLLKIPKHWSFNIVIALWEAKMKQHKWKLPQELGCKVIISD